MGEPISAANEERRVDSWMDSVVRGVRQYSYQLGRLFNRFCFHFDQAHALAYRFREASAAEQRHAVSAFRDVEALVQAFDPARPDRLVPLSEFRELIQDASFLRTQFESLREKCDARGTAPEVHEILCLYGRARDGVPKMLLDALDHGDESAFQLGIVVDQGIRPSHVADLLYLATVVGDSWPETSPQPVRVGGVRPEASWKLAIAARLADYGCEIPAPSIKESGAEWFEVIHELDKRLRSEPPAAGRSSSRLEVDVATLQVRWNGVAYKVSDKGALFLKGLKLIFDDPDRHGEYVSARQLTELLGVPEFRSDQAKAGIPPALLELVEKRVQRGGHRLKECVA